MMTKCPDCGSTEILSDLVVFGGYQDNNIRLIMVDPKKKGESVVYGIRAALCCGCGHVDLYTKYYKEFVEAKNKGYVTRVPGQ